MTIIIKNKEKLKLDDFFFRRCIGKKGLIRKKIEGEKKTPIGLFSIGDLYYRKDRISKFDTKLKSIKIKRNMGWCDDINSKNYNKLINVKEKIKHENIYRHA